MRRLLLLRLVLVCVVLSGCGTERETCSDGAQGAEGAEGKIPASTWFAGLRSDDVEERAEALSELAGWYEGQATGLVEREAARDALLPVLDDLARIARDDDIDCSRWNAVLLLGEMGRRSLPATDALAHAIKEKDPDLRKLAIEGLAEIASPCRGMFSGVHAAIHELWPPETQEVMARWNPTDPERAYGALYVRSRDKALEAVFGALMRDTSLDVKQAAAHHLGSWGPDAVHYATDLLPYLRHEDRDLRQNMLYTLRALEPPASVVMQPYIDFIRATSRRDMRGIVMIQGALLGLGELGPDAIGALNFLGLRAFVWADPGLEPR